MIKIGICGHFSLEKALYNGQTIKTKILFETLVTKYGSDEVLIIDTHNWKNKKIELLRSCIDMFRNCENIIFLPSINGSKVFIKLFYYLNKIYSRNIFYFVIGARLDKTLKNNKNLMKKIKVFKKVYVETEVLKEKLLDLDITNVSYLRNFKDLTPINRRDVQYNFEKPFRLFTFSRVVKHKGIEDAIQVIKEINERTGELTYTLDIFGEIEPGYEDSFFKLVNDNKNFIFYKGIVEYDNTTKAIKDYFFLLFPTKNYEEGVPGTIIDAFAAGIPVIASRWESSEEVVNNQVGFIYEFDNLSEFSEILLSILNKPEQVDILRVNALNESKKYQTDVALEAFFYDLENKIEEVY